MQIGHPLKLIVEMGADQFFSLPAGSLPRGHPRSTRKNTVLSVRHSLPVGIRSRRYTLLSTSQFCPYDLLRLEKELGSSSRKFTHW